MTAAGPFDITRVRRNWDRGETPPESSLSPGLAQVVPPRDTLAIARALLRRAERMALTEHAPHETTLAPFFAEATRLLDRLTQHLPTDTPETAHEIRHAFEQQVHDLEELLEVFAYVAD